MPRIKPHHADAYLRHTVEGVPIRDLAREAGCYASTITRRVQLVEDSRDCPVWAAIWDEISDVVGARADARPLDMDTLLFYLGTNESECAVTLATARSHGPSATITIGLDPRGRQGGSAAVVEGAGRPTASFADPRPVLGLVLMGFARPRPGEVFPRAARLDVLKPAAGHPVEPVRRPEEGAPAIPRWASGYSHLPGAALIAQIAKPRRGVPLFSHKQIDLALTMAESASMDPARFSEEINRLDLGETLSTLLRALFLDGVGFEAAERAQRLPARSAKVVLRIALDQCLGKFAA